MRNILFVLLLLPFALFAQTDWNKPLYPKADAAAVESTDEESAEVSTEVPPAAVRLKAPARDSALIVAEDESGFVAWLTNSKSYFINDDSLEWGELKSLIEAVPKANSEFRSAKFWAFSTFICAITGIVGANVVIWGSDDVRTTGAILFAAGFSLESLSARFYNNHLNRAVDYVNESRRPHEEPSSDDW